MSRVLLVEADESIRASLTRALGRFGHEVIAAGDAREALASMRRHRPDVLLTEHQLGGDVTGSMILEHCALVSPGCARVLMSNGDIPQEVLRRGAHEVYLAKPFSIHVVAATLGDLSSRDEPRAA